MSNENFWFALLKKMSNEGFTSLKNNIAANCKLLKFQQEEYAMYNLLSVLFENHIRYRLVRSDFAKIVGCMISERSAEELLVRYVTELENASVYKEKAQYKNKDVIEYDDHLITFLIPTLKEKISNLVKMEDEIVLLLVDIFKTVTCIYQYREKSHFVFSSNEKMYIDMINHLISLYHNRWEEKEFKANESHSIRQKFTLAYVEKRPYLDLKNFSLIMSMILYEIAMDQDGIRDKTEGRSNE